MYHVIPGTHRPEFQKRNGHAPYRIPRQPESRILPDAKTLHQIGIFIRQIESSRIGNLSVNYDNLLMIPEIHKELAHIFVDGIEDLHLDPFFPQFCSKIPACPKQRSKVVIEEFHFDALRHLAFQYRMYLIPQSALCHNKEFNKDKPLCLLQVCEKVLKGIFAKGIVFRLVIFIDGGSLRLHIA